MKIDWKTLVGEPQLCEGGRLFSIIFCCDPRRRPCNLLEKALSLLGITKERFIEVMEKHKVSIKERDGSCYGNLAFAPSIEKASEDRDFALRELGWSLTQFFKYKFEILRDLIPQEKLEYAFSTRLLRQYAVEILDLETKKVYKALALGSIEEGMLAITEVFNERHLKDHDLEEAIDQTAYVGVRIPKSIIDQLDEMVMRGIIQSRSDGIRRALLLYLEALKTK